MQLFSQGSGASAILKFILINRYTELHTANTGKSKNHSIQSHNQLSELTYRYRQ